MNFNLYKTELIGRVRGNVSLKTIIIFFFLLSIQHNQTHNTSSLFKQFFFIYIVHLSKSISFYQTCLRWYILVIIYSFDIFYATVTILLCIPILILLFVFVLLVLSHKDTSMFLFVSSKCTLRILVIIHRPLSYTYFELYS